MKSYNSSRVDSLSGNIGQTEPVNTISQSAEERITHTNQDLTVNEIVTSEITFENNNTLKLKLETPLVDINTTKIEAIKANLILASASGTINAVFVISQMKDDSTSFVAALSDTLKDQFEILDNLDTYGVEAKKELLDCIFNLLDVVKEYNSIINNTDTNINSQKILLKNIPGYPEYLMKNIDKNDTDPLSAHNARESLHAGKSNEEISELKKNEASLIESISTYRNGEKIIDRVKISDVAYRDGNLLYIVASLQVVENLFESFYNSKKEDRPEILNKLEELLLIGLNTNAEYLKVTHKILNETESPKYKALQDKVEGKTSTKEEELKLSSLYETLSIDSSSLKLLNLSELQLKTFADYFQPSAISSSILSRSLCIAMEQAYSKSNSQGIKNLIANLQDLRASIIE